MANSGQRQVWSKHTSIFYIFVNLLGEEVFGPRFQSPLLRHTIGSIDQAVIITDQPQWGSSSFAEILPQNNPTVAVQALPLCNVLNSRLLT